ncbi:glycosyltransferase, partial [Flavobacteriaceae bacterium]|nr:glycosyltransferase [Flavobacteriaceae bacterium]
MSIVRKMSNKIVILTGGTGGHIFPAQALAKELSNNGFKVTILANKNYPKFHSDNKYQYKVISSAYLRENISILLFPMKILYGFCQSFFWLLFHNPKKIISFGSYATFPPLIAAVLLQKTIIIHEQNSVMGKVNKLFVKYAKYIVTSYPNTSGIAAEYLDKVIQTGNPIRQDILALKNHPFKLPVFLQEYDKKLSNEYFDNNIHKFNILILGGSGGANIFGEKIVQSFSLLKKDLISKLSITHQCHKDILRQVNNSYNNHQINAKLAPFFSDIKTEIKKSHLIISRSGSSSISEFSFAKKPMILVPFAKASENHQLKNAQHIK